MTIVPTESAMSTDMILQDILHRLPEARRSSEHDFWATWYNADIQYLLGKLQNAESLLAKYKSLSASHP